MKNKKAKKQKKKAKVSTINKFYIYIECMTEKSNLKELIEHADNDSIPVFKSFEDAKEALGNVDEDCVGYIVEVPSFDVYGVEKTFKKLDLK